MPLPGMPGSDQPSPSRRTALWKAPPFQPPAERAARTPAPPTGDALGYRVGLQQNPDFSAYRQFLDSVAAQRPGAVAGSKSIFGTRRPMSQIWTGLR